MLAQNYPNSPAIEISKYSPMTLVSLYGGIMGSSMNIVTIYFLENKYEQTIESIDNLIV